MNLIPTPHDNLNRIRLEFPDPRNDNIPSGILVATLEAERVQTCGGYYITCPQVELAALFANAQRMHDALDRLADGEWPAGITADDAITATRKIAREAVAQIRAAIREQTGEEPAP